MNPQRKAALIMMIIFALFMAMMAGAWVAVYQHEKSLGVLSITRPEVTAADAEAKGTMAVLKERAQEDPKDTTLQQAIRIQDVELRREYFLNRRRFALAAYLLLAAGAGLLASARWFVALGPAKSAEEIINKQETYRPARGAAAIACTALAGCLVLGLYALTHQPNLPGSERTTPSAKAVANSQATNAAASVTTTMTTTPTATTTPASIPAANVSAFKQNWPNFRGAGNIGVAPAGDWPTTWSAAANHNILWKTEIPATGKSSPILWGERIFLTGGDQKEHHVLAFDRATGKLLWNTTVPPPAGAGELSVFEDTGFAAPTPATDGQRVFVFFASGVMAALDFDGKILWTKSFGTPESMYGLASSPIVHEGTVILQLDMGSEAEAKKSNLYGLDPATGSPKWTTPRPVPNSWASPAIINTGQRAELITCANPLVIAYDPATGKELWQADGLGGDVAPSPAFATSPSGEGIVYVTNDMARTMAIRPGGAGDVTASQILWKAESGMPDIASPVSDGRRVLLVNGSGSLTCLSADGGKTLWEQRLECTLSSSPILSGSRIYLSGQDGVTRIFDLADTFKLQSTGEIGEPIHATPAFGDGRIYIRGTKHLVCVGSARP